ncbi:hypothetical protein, conserved [Thermococcus onnurineus NA1]|uniref:Uncharacterized protein n=2 Tax=Thermococcus TaxID=2263 RepID=B6YWW3_THEON|nr:MULTISPECIES: hypothetical protein [Thermococcus]ACJ16576.1 hypothetical protein, conserved [Thermococcus onnurineus NA1]NJE47422.1 hypothetical protein [Thermococcus sp. GR7]NJF23472.1 hypothetical protein [Thermococcus sp. GR5]
MPVLGFNITKVEMEKKAIGVPGGQIEVRLSPKIKEMRLGEIRTPTGKMNGIEVLFRYEIDYNPKVAQGVIEGIILYVPPQKDKMDEILNLWEDEKKMDPVTFAEIVNFITKEVSPMIMLLAKEMRLPYHIPLPRVEVKS